MKKKTYLFALMAMVLTLGSCSDNENGIGGETSKYITVSTSIGNMTRVATDANGGQTFEEGDEISVYAWTGDATVAPETRERVVNNAINKLTNGLWISTPQMLWKNNRDKHYFIGVYPISASAISDLSAGEYTFDETKQVESDLLVAVNKDGLSYNVDEQQPVPLTFTHVMAKLVVNLTYKNQWGTEGPTVDKVAVGNAVKKATINYLTKVVTPSTTAKEDFSLPEITENTKYVSVIIPQEDVTQLTIVIDGKNFVYDNGTPFKLESGKITTVNLEVGRDEIKLGDVKITDWENGSTFSGEALN